MKMSMRMRVPPPLTQVAEILFLWGGAPATVAAAEAAEGPSSPDAIGAGAAMTPGAAGPLTAQKGQGGGAEAGAAARAAAAREAAEALPALLQAVAGAADGPLGAALRHAAPVRLAKVMAALAAARS